MKPARRSVSTSRKKIKKARQELRERQEAEGIFSPPQTSVSNALCPYKSIEEEQEAREEAVASQISIYRSILPKLLRKFSRISDPRVPKKIKHKLTVLLVYGLLACVFQMASRREANRKMSRPAFMETLQSLFPELETIPHADTLNRLLERIDVQEIEAAHVDLIRSFVRKKKFCRLLISKCHPIAIDGTQKLVRDGDKGAEEWLERWFKARDGKNIQRYVYVLEANLVFHNGLTLPLLSEFLSHVEGDPDDQKQDCELKAFQRLAKRLKDYFPRLPIMLLLDGLYPNGPLIELCRSYGWQFMIVLPDKCLRSVWKEAESRRTLESNNESGKVWKGRFQYFWWVNNIQYSYDHDKKSLTVHLVVCEEEWDEVDVEKGEIVTKNACHAWVSSNPLRSDNVHERCNLGARYRWGIEVSIQTEKCGGYHYEHAYSYSWQAMKGFHYLMRLAHMMNAITLHTKRAAKQVRTMGIQAFLDFVRETCANRWLRPEWIKELLIAPFQFRLL